MDIGDWLRGLGLSQYEAAFRENSIDFEVLTKLTSDDLRELGIVSVGPRRRLLAAIEELSRTGVATSAVAWPAGPGVAELAPAERRHLTVMFIDLVGSTALAARLDPEDMREVVAAYHKCCAGLIASNGGFVAKYMGDGVLAYFGYPQAHEHDAERAVRAGLAIVEATPKLVTPSGAPLHLRVGIATGIVVVGDLLGSGESRERGVVGDTPNLAARLQGIAEPDSVVLAEGTRRLLGDLFELVDLGPQDLKGLTRPTRAYSALREGSQEGRFEALHGGGLTALIGRDEELELLLRRWTKIKKGEGQVVLISGEAGIGKSRLTVGFMELLTGEPHARMRYFCSPQHADSALYPIIGHMERAARFFREDEAKTKLDKLDALLARSGTSPEETALLAEMLSLPNDGRYAARELAPQQRRQKTMEALIGQIEVISRQSPVLMIFEDAHWADPSSLELFGRLVDRIDALRVLLFVTFRPEFVAPWVGRPQVTSLSINRLAKREVISLIEDVRGNRALAEHIRQDIIERTDGVPLFVEEMTKAVLEAEGEAKAKRIIASVPSPAVAVPASLHASLMARLDRLGEAKGVAQIGAAIGREFSHALLVAIARESEAELGAHLDCIAQAGLLIRQGLPPHAIYLFKHALIQDTAYGSLLREPRRALHARIAEAIEVQFPHVAESQPETLARHFTEAGLLEKAAQFCGKAGLRSLARSALIEAEVQLTRALAQIASLPGTPALRREQITLEVALIAALMHIKGYAAPETKTAIERARLSIERTEQLGEEIEDPLLLFTVIYSFWAASLIAFNSETACGLSAQFLGLAEQRSAEVPLLVALRAVGVSSALAGDIAKARRYLDRAVELSESRELRAQALRFGQDPRATALSYRAWLLWGLGYPESAATDAERASTAAREIGHAASLMHALAVSSMCLILSGNFEASIASCDELVATADEKGFALWRAWGTLNRGCVLVLSGKALEAEQVIRTAIAAFRSTGATVWTPCYLTFLARALSDIGHLDEALAFAREARAITKMSGELWFVSDIHRTMGHIALLSSEPNLTEAQSQFERSLEIARERQARSFELRSAISLARLWRDQGKRQEAHDLLVPVYSWFTEGFDTLDLKEAKALLDELAS